MYRNVELKDTERKSAVENIEKIIYSKGQFPQKNSYVGRLILGLSKSMNVWKSEYETIKKVVWSTCVYFVFFPALAIMK